MSKLLNKGESIVIQPKKRNFISSAKGTAEERQAVALEFIAHYLDLIESHLDKLSSGEPNAMLVSALGKLEKAVRK